MHRFGCMNGSYSTVCLNGSYSYRVLVATKMVQWPFRRSLRYSPTVWSSDPSVYSYGMVQ